MTTLHASRLAAHALLLGLGLAGCAISHVPQGGGGDGGPEDVVALDAPDVHPGEGGLRDGPDGDVSMDVPRDVPMDVPRDVPMDVPTDRVTCDTSCDGGCANLATDVHNCGGCGVDCTTLANVDPARVTCSAGACVLTNACLSGYGDCSSSAPGCETRLNASPNCGACGTTCSGGTPVCRPAAPDAGGPSAVCDTGCGPGQMACTSGCSDLTDDLNCGSCNNACVAPANGSSHCTAGSCVPACNTGYHLCGSSCVADNDITACGATCTRCGNPPSNATEGCINGVCTPVCNTGYHLCGTTCKQDTDVGFCGAACTACTNVANASESCNGGVCAFACNTNFHACPDNTCAADNDSNRCTSSCTACPFTGGNGSAACVGNACVVNCSGGYHACGNSCASDTSITQCGASCTTCAPVSHGTASCMNGSCTANCDTGWVTNGPGCQMPDNCSTIMNLNVVKNTMLTINGDTRGLTDDYQPAGSNCGGGAGPDVVYHLTFSARGTVTFVLTPAGWAGSMYVDNTCGASAVNCGASAAPSAPVTFTAMSGASGDTGYLTIDGVSATDAGAFTLTILLQ